MKRFGSRFLREDQELMLLPGNVACRAFGSHMLVVSWRRGTAAVPKIYTEAQKIPVGFAKAEEPRTYEHRIKLVIRPAPEDGWYVIQQNGLLKSYLQLSKARLTAMVTATTVCGFIIAPVDLSLGPLAACTVGTALLSATANTFNHLLETPYDAQMRRTQSRLLVVHRLIIMAHYKVLETLIAFRFSPFHAVGFALSTAIIGMVILWTGCNPLTAALGLLNAFLYAGVYTPMKRYSIGCTWVGAVVGAIPPLMGYAGATGSIKPASLVLAALLYCWQFPHFNALSWNLRSDYTRAGYRVMCAVNQRLCRFTSLSRFQSYSQELVTGFRYSVLILLLCSLGAPLTNLTKWLFAVESLPLNGLLLYLSYKFYRHPDAKTSRMLFHYSLLHLPLIMMLMIISKFDGDPSGFE